MDFFEAQDRAKRNTSKLIFYYVLAVIGIILSVYVVTLMIFQTQVSGETISLWNPFWLFSVAVIIVCVIITGTLFRVSQLRKGGSAVAELLGGRKIPSSTTEAGERQLMNIVEEMSIASGLPVPDVFVLDKEENINAFAAGFGTNDAAVGVTRGAIEQLNRDELQGVIAHEFSHIFNGDMRLNIRLIGILNGILIIHVMGMILLRTMFYSGGVRVKSDRDGKGGNGALVVLALGISLIVIGYIGMIFGRMIQSAISRQREYLADAAAVQYTRNPDGLAGALHKIGLKKKGAEIKDGHAMEMSHLFFASSYHTALDKLYSTHPPLEQRIKAINPSFAETRGKQDSRIRDKFKEDHVAASKSTPSGTKGVAGHSAITPEVILAAIGGMESGQAQKAKQLLAGIPDNMKQAVHELFSAEALIYAMMFSTKKQEESIPEWFRQRVGEEMVGQTTVFVEELKDSKREWMLPLTEMALPTLRDMSKDQYTVFREVLTETVSAEEFDTLFLLALEKMVVHQLDTAFSDSKDREIKHFHLKTLGNELSVLLSALAYASGKDPQTSWDAGLSPIKSYIPQNLTLLPKDKCGIKDLDTVLDELAVSANPVKKFVTAAVIYCITSDKKITIEEAELTRAVSEVLGAPIPLGVMM